MGHGPFMKAAGIVIVYLASALALTCGGKSQDQAVFDAINELFLQTDERNWPAVRSVFAPRVRFDMSSLTGQPASELTAEEITAAWEKGLKPLAAIHHQTGNYRIRVEGDRAEAFCYGTATHYLPTRSGRNVRSFVGSYDFVLDRLDGKWKISAFKFNFKYMDGNPNLEAEAL